MLTQYYIQFGVEHGNVGENLPFEIKFTNPLQKPMTDVTVTIEGPGFAGTGIYSAK